MTTKEKIVFELLKTKVSEVFLKENPAQSTDISQWKGEDIVRFQEDLLHKVKGRVSEKWFYNYFRNDIQKLPRIDMLNLLSEYVGYKNWADFMYQNSKQQKSKTKLKFFGLFVLLAIMLGSSFVFWNQKSTTAIFYLVDESGNNVQNVEIRQLFDHESDRMLMMKNNSVKIEVKDKEIRLKIVSPYYKDKIITRKITGDTYKENIVLQVDLYALLLKRYSVAQTGNWQKRRKYLQSLLADNALIYQQWFGSKKGIELYDKDDFIAQLCIPTGVLRNIEILEIVYKNEKIIKLRFTVNESELLK